MKEFIRTRWMYLVLVGGLFILFDLILNFTLYNPAFITPIYGYFVDHGFLPTEESGEYPLVSIKKLSSGFYGGPRATAEGVVTFVQKSQDGDVHINISDGTYVVVCEIVPEFPLPLPEVGQRIRIWGIPRYDLEHRWGELHPVFGWENV